MTFKTTNLALVFREKCAGCATAIRNFKERYKSVFINSAVAFMAIKLGLIFLATFATMAYFLSTASQYLAMETSKPKAMLLISPLILIIVVKVCFMIKILATHGRARVLVKSAAGYVWLKGKGGLRLAKESVPVGLSTPARERVKAPRF
jgi:hypothetical protein